MLIDFAEAFSHVPDQSNSFDWVKPVSLGFENHIYLQDRIAVEVMALLYSHLYDLGRCELFPNYVHCNSLNYFFHCDTAHKLKPMMRCIWSVFQKCQVEMKELQQCK